MSELRPGSFQILPTIIKNLLIINGLVFLAQIAVEKSSNPSLLIDLLALHTWQSPLFKPWQFVTHLFMHGSFGHLLSNMFALWMFGSVLENLWGPKKFLTFYIVCGLGAALCHMIVLYFEMQPVAEAYKTLSYAQQQQLLSNPGFKLNQPTVGASGAVFGCLAAFGYLYPNMYIYIYFFLPLKAKWFVLIYAGFELFMALQNSAGDNVAHYAHLGGAIFGLALAYFWNKSNRRLYY